MSGDRSSGAEAGSDGAGIPARSMVATLAADGPATQAVTRVLMILDTFSFGGAENLIVELARHAPDSLKLSVASLAPRRQDLDAMADRIGEVGLAPTYLSVRRMLDPWGFLRLVRTLRRAPIDVVHAHLDYSATLVPLAARLAGKPVVATLHVSPQPDPGRGAWLKERLSVWIPGRLGRLVLVSRHIFDEYARIHGPARASWRVIPNGVDLDRYGAQHDSRDSDAPVWAVVAALRPDKNHLGLIRAWEGVVKIHPKATLLIVGDGPARAEIERAVDAAGLGGSVQLLGRREDVPEILRTVHGVVSASVDEALPTALIEAGACGLPVVAADAGGTREIVIDGVNGRLVPLRDTDALTEALVGTIADPELAAAYGAAGRALVEEKYTLPAWIAQLHALYAEVIDATR